MNVLTHEQQELLNRVVREYLMAELSSPLRGRLIRAGMPGNLADRLRLLQVLSVVHLRQEGVAPDHDSYAPTAAGVLASNSAEIARAVLAAILATLKDKHNRDPGFRAFSFAELQQNLTDPSITERTVERIVLIFELTHSEFSFDTSTAWARPPLLEQVIELASGDEFLAWLVHHHPDRDRRARAATRRARRRRRLVGKPMLRTIHVGAAPDLTWMRDDALRRIAQADFLEMKLCLTAGAHKATVLLAGSVCESMLLDMLERNVVITKTYFEKKPTDFPNRTSLERLVEIATAEGLVTDTALHLAPAVKNYRDLIHPHRVRTNRIKIDEHTARLLVQTADIIGRDLGDATTDGRAAAFEDKGK